MSSRFPDPVALRKCELVRIIYRSRSQICGTKAQISAAIGEILNQARENNPRHGVTGVLFFNGRFFSQTLEGPPPAVARLYANVLRDRRHVDIQLLQQDVADARCFDHWAMAYMDGMDGAGFTIPSGQLRHAMHGLGGEGGAILELMQFAMHGVA